jgi:hypothetical protein
MFAKPRLNAGMALAAMLSAMPAVAGEGDTAAYHVYPTKPIRDARAGAMALLRNTTGRMLYYGGPVISKTRIATVIWGSSVNRTTVLRIGPFLSGLVNSTFVDQLAPQYDTNIKAVDGRQGTNQTIARGTYLGQFQITPYNKSTSLTDAAIRAEIKKQIAAGKVPANDLNTLYMIYFPSSVHITLGTDKSCVTFAAYHGATSTTVIPGNIFYGVMPDCGTGFADLTVASSHEFAESVTDAIPTPGSHPAYPQAWNTSNGYEIGDLCEGTYSRLTVGATIYRVQEVYLNSTAACGKARFTSP